jgi:transmembrane sensor
VTPEIAAEAAVWVARLHGPDRSSGMERECVAWQGRSAAHALAFERCTETWQAAAGLTLRAYASESSAGMRAGRWRQSPARVHLAAAVALVLGVLGGASVFPWRAGLYETGVGEQRVVVLGDGSRMSLNTSTRAHVGMSASLRSVKIEHGEAYFEVAKDVGRPFIVQAGGATVTATGTAFAVRSADEGSSGNDALMVTLVEGQVVVRASAGAVDGKEKAVVLAPGERLRVRAAGMAPGRSAGSPLDRPRLDQALSWRRGEVVFDDIALLEAVAEMNRYSTRAIVVRDTAAVRSMRVSGVFRTGETRQFANALAELHGLRLVEMPDRFELMN